MKNKTLHFGEIAPFELSIKYCELDSRSPLNVNDPHVHDECEIYVNVSGDVSFVVEHSIYPLSSGSVIISRPNEFHHCIYNSNALHKHYWILFSPKGNKRFFSAFFDRQVGQSNLYTFKNAKKEELFDICAKLTDNTNETERFGLFFRLISLLNADAASSLPIDDENDLLLTKAINFIDEYFTFDITVKQIAKECFVSVNTLERRFMKTMRISPRDYIKKKRLAGAVKMLSDGYSVSDAAFMNGFSDVSAFIVYFKRNYGTTPLKYKKSLSED